MAVFLSVAPPQGLLPKVDSTVAPTHYYNKLANPYAQLSQQPTRFQDSLLGQANILQLLIYHI